jgi:hypothetical protein
MVRQTHPVPEEATYSGNAIDSMRALATQIKSILPHRHVAFEVTHGRPELKISMVNEHDLELLDDLHVRVEDPSIHAHFDDLEVFTDADGWTSSGLPHDILMQKYNRDNSVAHNKIRVEGKRNDQKFLQLGLVPLRSLDEISRAYDPALSLFGRNKRLKGLTLRYKN